MTLPAIRRRSVVDVFSSSDLHLSRLFSFSFSFSLPFLFDSCTDPSRRPTIDEFVVDTDRPTNSTAIPRISSPSFLSTRHVLSLSLFPPRVPIIDAKTIVSSPHPFLSIPSVHVFPCAHSSHIAPFFLFLSYTSPLHTFSLSPLSSLSFFS